jgi:hypothetical protein
MSLVPVPSWTVQQVLPPIDAADPTSPHRSPYNVSVEDFVRAYATSWERCKILKGFLTFRSELHAVGLSDGFQWVNGSFTENVEVLANRPPGDVDVVTFVSDPNDDAAKLSPDLTSHLWVKQHRRVDHYMIGLDEVSPSQLVSISAYWYSMWSHRRNSLWKGFLQIDLASHGDADALLILDAEFRNFSAPNPTGGATP